MALARLAILRRVSEAWRGPLFAVLTERPWRPILLGVGGALVLAPLAVRAETWLKTVLFYGVMALALSLTRGMVGAERTTARWLLLFQRPVTPRAHHLRVAAANLSALLLLIVLTWGVHAALASRVWSAVALNSLLVTALAWGTIIFAASLCTATLVRRGDTELALLWTLMPVVVALLTRGFAAGPRIQAVAEWLMPPLNAVFGLQAHLMDAREPWHARWATQLATFPAVCLAIAWWRLRRLEAADAPGAEE